MARTGYCAAGQQVSPFRPGRRQMGGARRGRVRFAGLVAATVLVAGLGPARAADKPTSSQGPTLSIGDSTVTEGNSGQVAANFTVTLSPASAAPVSVHYATKDNTATAPSDYVAAAGVLVFQPN